MTHPSSIALIILSLLGLAGCAKGPSSSSNGVKEVLEAGGARITLTLDRQEATVADRLHLQLEAATPEGAEVSFPELGEKLGEFGVRREDSPGPMLVSGNRTLRVRIYALEPFLAGTYVIPPLEFAVKKGDKTQAVRTREIKVPVRSVFGNAPAPAEIHDIAAPVRPPARHTWIWWVLALVLLGAGIWFWVTRRRGSNLAAVAPPLPAHELAWRQLQELVDENLPGRGEIKLYYQRLSSILRHYIENRFGLHVPGQTTEEFLRDLQRGDSLMQGHRELLRDFLQHCDLVKFAEHQPVRADMDEVLESCRNFIRETKVTATPTSTPAAV